MDKLYEKFIERMRVISMKIAEIKAAIKTMDHSSIKQWNRLLHKVDEDYRETNRLIRHMHNDSIHFRVEDEIDAEIALKNLEYETRYALHKLLDYWGEKNRGFLEYA